MIGSPPHTRGTLNCCKMKLWCSRITPAYTGNTLFIYKTEKPVKDHPRIHGEHTLTVCLIGKITGSPPHTRGTPCRKRAYHHLCRITPAYTGNTDNFKTSNKAVQDHPRIHGEHIIFIKHWKHNRGSPPHTRGTPIAKCQKLMS